MGEVTILLLFSISGLVFFPDIWNSGSYEPDGGGGGKRRHQPKKTPKPDIGCPYGDKGEQIFQEGIL